MSTLAEVQLEVISQMRRDYKGRDKMRVQSLCTAGLAEEAGEVNGLWKRELRDLPKDRARCTQVKYIEELGDVLWYLVAVATLKGISLETIWNYNILKLEERYADSCGTCSAGIEA